MEATEPFTVERSAVARTLLSKRAVGWPLWSAVTAGLLLTASGCLWDLRLTVLGLMVCVAVAPSVAALIYFSRTLAPDMVANLLPHTLERQDGGYLLRLWRRPDPEVPEEAGMDWMESGCISLSDSNIVERKTSGEYEMLFYKDSGMKILYVPRFKK